MSISSAFIARPIATSLLMAGDPAGRCGRLSVASGSTAAASRFPDNPGDDAATRRQPRDHGILGHPAAGAAIRADTRGHADDVEQLARQQRNHRPVPPVAQHRPYADDPRVGHRRSVHIIAYHRSRCGSNLHLPAQPVGDNNPKRRCAVGARRHLRDHVCAGLQPRQFVADGADDRGRLCRRRCDRHARKYRPPSRGWPEPDGGGDQGLR